MNKSKTLIAMLIMILSFTGCASDKQYRTDTTPCNCEKNKDACSKAAIEVHDGYKISFVEFDDQGWFWNFDQLEATKNMIKEESKKDDLLIIIYIHGWKHNADYNDSNVIKFRDVLCKLYEIDKNKGGKILGNRKIVGVYAGWRGLSATYEPFKTLSFWERKNTAHKVGYGSMIDLLVSVENLQKAINKSPVKGHKTELVLIGHSFGGAVLYSALSQIMSERLVTKVEYDKDKTLKSFGDLVIFLNPAFEASRYDNLNKLANSLKGKYSEKQKPVMSVITSKGDIATQYAFPIGRFISTFFETYRNDEAHKYQRESDRKAVGWFDRFITHDLNYTGTGEKTTDKNIEIKNLERSVDAMLKNKEKARKATTLKSIALKSPACNIPKKAFTGFELVSKDQDKNKGIDQSCMPFLVMSADKKIIADHGDIENQHLIDFLIQFIIYSRQ